METNDKFCPQSIEEFIAALNSRNINVRLNALTSIPAAMYERLTEQLVSCAYHWDPAVRLAAFQALIMIKNVSLETVIRDGLSDPNKEVRLAASKLFHKENLAA